MFTVVVSGGCGAGDIEQGQRMMLTKMILIIYECMLI